MLKLFSLAQSAIFMTLSLLHFFWALGGKWGMDKAVPVTKEGKNAINPGPFACIMVGLALMFTALFYLVKVSAMANHVPGALRKYFGKFVALIFFLRAMGDFKYCGLSKRVKGTEFAKWDSILFTPICLKISSIAIIIEWLSEQPR